MHTLSEHFVFPCTPKRTPNCTPKPEKRHFSPLSGAVITQKRLDHCSNQCSSRSSSVISAFYPFKASLFLAFPFPAASYQLTLPDHRLFVEYHPTVSQPRMQQRALLYPHLILRQNAVYSRYGAEIIVLPPLYQMHMYHLCHIRPFPFVSVIAIIAIYYLISSANIPNNNYLEEYTSIKTKK